MKTVYIASPYTHGDQLENVNRSFDAANELIELGFAPYAPLYSHFLNERTPQPYEVWMKIDEEWLLRCDCLLRLPGESSGADNEVALAKQIGISVYYNIQDIR